MPRRTFCQITAGQHDIVKKDGRAGEQLARLQRAFILSGRKRDLAPLQMDTIGANLDLNKSTISRALANRSVLTDHGVFDARMFFVRKANSNLENATVEDVLRKLSSILKSETGGRVYSDEQISQKLMAAKMPVCRRTVSKYRKIMDIPPAFQRKKIAPGQKTAKRVSFHL